MSLKRRIERLEAEHAAAEAEVVKVYKIFWANGEFIGYFRHAPKRSQKMQRRT